MNSTHQITHQGKPFNPFAIIGVSPTTFRREDFLANYRRLEEIHLDGNFWPIIEKSYIYIRQWEAAGGPSASMSVRNREPVRASTSEQKFDVADFNRRFEEYHRQINSTEQQGYSHMMVPSEYSSGDQVGSRSYSSSVAPSDDITRQTLQMREMRRSRAQQQNEPMAQSAFSTMDSFDYLGDHTGYGAKSIGTDYMEAHTDEFLTPTSVGFDEQRQRTLEQYMAERGGDISIDRASTAQHHQRQYTQELNLAEERRQRQQEFDQRLDQMYQNNFGQFNLPSYQG